MGRKGDRDTGRVASSNSHQQSRWPDSATLPNKRKHILRQLWLTALVTILLVIAVAYNNFPAPISPRPFQSSSTTKTLKISIFSDLHFGEAESTAWGPAQDIKTLHVMSSVLDREMPDLVVLNGDLITGDDTLLANATDYFDRLVAPMVQRDIPWASTYGNHDNEFNLSAEGILEKERGYFDLSLTEKMVTGDPETVGVTNYFVPLYRIGGDGPVAILWFFDSRGGKAFQKTGSGGQRVQLPGVVDPVVTAWFLRASRQLKRQHGDREIPSLAFVHIPVSAMRAFQKDGVDEHREPGINDDNPLDSQAGDEEFLNALRDQGVAAVFSGHDHGNDWCFPSTKGEKTLFACFSRHTGYGGYGQWMRGSRQIVLDHSGALETWVRLEDGDVSGHVKLNASYGLDVYPKVRKAFTSLGADGTRTVNRH